MWPTPTRQMHCSLADKIVHWSTSVRWLHCSLAGRLSG